MSWFYLKSRRSVSPDGGSTPTFVSATLDALGSVSNGDLVLLFFVGAGVGAPSAPTGWTQFATDTDGHGNNRAIYWSHYSGSNAAADSTNFPVSLGYFVTIVYAGSLSVLQTGSYGTSSGATTTRAATRRSGHLGQVTTGCRTISL